MQYWKCSARWRQNYETPLPRNLDKQGFLSKMFASTSSWRQQLRQKTPSPTRMRIWNVSRVSGKFPARSWNLIACWGFLFFSSVYWNKIVNMNSNLFFIGVRVRSFLFWRYIVGMFIQNLWNVKLEDSLCWTFSIIIVFILSML